MSDGDQQPAVVWPGDRPGRRPTGRPGWLTRLGPVGAALLALGKWAAVLLKLKALVLVGSMAVSVVAYAQLYGWRYATGFVVLLGLHESGHVVALRRRGVPAGLPVFVPFLGAFVSMKAPPADAAVEAETGLAGPVAGAAASALTALLAGALDSPLLRALAFTGFLINLFNLLPVLPLDGGRAAAALSPKLWLVGLLLLLGYEVLRPSPVVPVILVIGGFELWRRWRRRADTTAYYALTRAQRLRIGTVYILLIVALIYGLHASYVPRDLV